MFKPIVPNLRSIPRIIPRHVLNRASICRRSIFTDRKIKLSTTVATVGRKTTAITTTALVGGFVAYKLSTEPVLQAEAPATQVCPVKDLKSRLSAQHEQVKNSWEHPGVYAWGNNVGRVVAPRSNEDIIKSPRRIHAFDNVLLRDLKLDRDVGVAVSGDGDILQWGVGYAPNINEPEKTLTGKNITSVEISSDRVFALSKGGEIYSLPISKKDQNEGTKPPEPSWIPGKSLESDISYRMLKPTLGHFERVSKIASGRDHILLLTSTGRVFSAAASYNYPAKGQLGIFNLTFATRPANKPYDTCHEITNLSSFKITQIAAGDYHSLALDDAGRVFSFGDSTCGQLGFEYSPETSNIQVPMLLPLQGLYASQKVIPKVRKIGAGGANSYFCVDAEDTVTGRVSADLFSCGTGLWGNLGNGRWTHVQGQPKKVEALSGLFEYDDKMGSVVPIRLSSLSVGATHTSATMQNLTNVEASNSPSSPAHDVNYGSDVLWWGNNEFYQLGTRKRNNASIPVYIPPLDPVVAELTSDKGFGMTGSSTTGGWKGDEIGSARSTGKDQAHRFQVTPRKKITVNGRRADVEQRVVCGRGNSAVYSAV